MKKKQPPKSKLQKRADRFPHEYVIDLNGTRAAIRCGFSARTAASQASRLLRKANVIEAIERLKKEREDRVLVQADDVLRELVQIAKIDVRKVFDEFGNMLPVQSLPDEIAQCISSVEIEDLFEGKGDLRRQVGYTKKVKFWDKPKCLELLGRHLAMFTDNVNATVKEPDPIQFVTAKQKNETGRGN